MIVPKSTKQGKSVYYGPRDEVLPGQHTLINYPTGDRWELIGKVGKPFLVDGIEMVYGYPPTKEDYAEISKRQSREAWHGTHSITKGN